MTGLTAGQRELLPAGAAAARAPRALHWHPCAAAAPRGGSQGVLFRAVRRPRRPQLRRGGGGPAAPRRARRRAGPSGGVARPRRVALRRTALGGPWLRPSLRKSPLPRRRPLATAPSPLHRWPAGRRRWRQSASGRRSQRWGWRGGCRGRRFAAAPVRSASALVCADVSAAICALLEYCLVYLFLRSRAAGRAPKSM